MSTRQLAFFVDATRCTNCKTCEVACKDINGSAVGVRIRKVRTFEGGDFPRVFAYNISMSCNHCEDPACVAGCPAQAYTKRPEDGVVVHHFERCIGCRYCTWVCPYGSPQFDEAVGRIRKCDLCIGEIERGREPACVAACPTRVIEVGPLEALASRPSATMLIRGVPEPSVTRPACVYVVRNEAAL